MNISILPYERSDIPSVKRFNRRLKDAGANYSISESDISEILPKDEKTKLYEYYYLAKDENGEVRGGYIFKNQEFNINNKIIEIVDIRYPLSEGVVDKKYSVVGPIIIQDAQQRKRYIFALGMGGFQYPLPNMLRKIGWYMYRVPFFFKILNPHAFLNDFEYINKLKNSVFKRRLIKFVERLRLLNLFNKGLNLFSALHRLINHNKYWNVKSVIIEEFDSLTDELWENSKDYYSIVAKRESCVLNKLYPKESTRFHRIKILDYEKCIGWTVVICTKMNNDHYFGNLNVGTIVDAFSNPKHADILIYQSVKYLKKLKADLIISNHSNHIYGKAFINNGFINGPSNYIFALSKGFKDFFYKKIDFRNSFIMRGDGDGPINL